MEKPPPRPTVEAVYRFNPAANREVTGDEMARIFQTLGLTIPAATFLAFPKNIKELFALDLSTELRDNTGR